MQNQKKSEVLHDDHLKTALITASKVVVPATKAITPLFILVHVLLAVEATLLPLAGDSGAQVLRGETEREEDEFFCHLFFSWGSPSLLFFWEYPISEKILVEWWENQILKCKGQFLKFTKQNKWKRNYFWEFTVILVTGRRVKHKIKEVDQWYRKRWVLKQQEVTYLRQTGLFY